MIARPKNFRDVGEILGLWLDPSPVAAGRLFRGGAFDETWAATALGVPRTVLNLRRGPDPRHLEGVTLVHVPADDELENYDTRAPRVRRWLARALAELARAAPPVYVHCTSGRDRTGVVVAGALVLSGIDRAVATEEYMLSDGSDRARIEAAIAGVEANASDFDAGALRRWMFGPSA